MGGFCSICFTLGGGSGREEVGRRKEGEVTEADEESHPETELFQMQPRMHPRNSVAIANTRSASLVPNTAAVYGSSPPTPVRKRSIVAGAGEERPVELLQQVAIARRAPHPSSPTGDKHQQQHHQMSSSVLKILLLGAGESGKSTIVKQMKIIHGNGFSREELSQYRPIVYANIIEGVCQVIRIAESLGYLDKLQPEHVNYIRGIRVDEDSDDDDEDKEDAQANSSLVPRRSSKMQMLAPELVQAINYIWLESGVRYYFDNICHASYVLDSAAYFFEEINRIGAPDYLPNTMDVLKARLKTTGVTEYRFRSGPLNIAMYDLGGQRPERRSWIRSFDSVVTVIFCVALSEYDQFLLEQPKQNRLLESFQLFSDVIRSRYFINSSFVLFLNKIDIFREKIKSIPLNTYFPDYEGGQNADLASEHIRTKFVSLNQHKVPLYSYLTQATDTRNIELVFAAVRETVLTQALKQSGLF